MTRLLVLALAAAAGAASGCAPNRAVAEGESTTGPLRLAAEAWVERDTLRADLRLTNVGTRPVEVGYGACSARVLAWPDSARQGSPAFDTVRRWTVEGYAFLCEAYLAATTLAPGETLTADRARELRVATPLAEALANSVPDGRYWLTAEFDIAEIDRERAGIALRADLGPLDVALERPPLGTTASRYGARFSVDSVRVEGGRVRAVVRVEPVPHLGSNVVGWAPCAARVLAYADPARRDAAPRAGPPDASADAACGHAAPAPFARPGESPSDPPFFLAAEQAVQAEVDVPLADVLGGLPAGRYALAVAVRTLGGHGPLRALPPVHLVLGAAEWRP